MCPQCRPEYLAQCYRCGHRFREFESFYVVKRLMDQGGVEHPYCGIRYGRCQDCPRDTLAQRAGGLDWLHAMGEYKRRGEWRYMYAYCNEITWY